MLYLVRHAKAGSRKDWHDDDELRPLSKAGRKQAEQLAGRLAKRNVSALVASPYVRCVATLEPLGEATGESVIADDRLAEGTGFVGAIELLESLPDGSVLCSHGDVIPATMEALQRRGCEFDNEPDWRKATVWLIDRNAEGQFKRAKVWAPPS
jgi:8-oxo-dGTP diphosphatase